MRVVNQLQLLFPARSEGMLRGHASRCTRTSMCAGAETSTTCMSCVQDVVYQKLIPGHERDCSCEWEAVPQGSMSAMLDESRMVQRVHGKSTQCTVYLQLCAHMYVHVPIHPHVSDRYLHEVD